MAKQFYAVRVGRVSGVYATYAQAHEQINRFPNGEIKGFNDHDEALAYMSQPGDQYHSSAAGPQPGRVDAEAIRDHAKKAVLEAQSDTLRQEDELTRATMDVSAKQEALIKSWATVNTKAEAYANAEARVEGREKETLYLHGCAVFTTLLAAQRFSDGKVVYICHSQEEIRKMVADSGREFYTTFYIYIQFIYSVYLSFVASNCCSMAGWVSDGVSDCLQVTSWFSLVGREPLPRIYA